MAMLLKEWAEEDEYNESSERLARAARIGTTVQGYDHGTLAIELIREWFELKWCLQEDKAGIESDDQGEERKAKVSVVKVEDLPGGEESSCGSQIQGKVEVAYEVRRESSDIAENYRDEWPNIRRKYYAPWRQWPIGLYPVHLKDGVLCTLTDVRSEHKLWASINVVCTCGGRPLELPLSTTSEQCACTRSPPAVSATPQIIATVWEYEQLSRSPVSDRD
jgi:hypothetical protein